VKITISLGQKWPQTPYLVGAVIYFHVFPSISIEFGPKNTSSGWWFGTFFIFPYIGNVIIRTDSIIFQWGRVGQPLTSHFSHVFFSDG